MNELTTTNTFNFEITSLQQAMEYAKLISESDLAPKDFKGKPGNVLIAIQMGIEVGLKPMQAIQNIAVINGRPALWGDAMLALVQTHPLCETIVERISDDGSIAYSTVKRRGEQEYTYSFSKDQAKQAGLLTKPGPWMQYTSRMLQMRARSFALRDKFADVLKGIAMREEVADYQDVEYKVVEEKKVEDLNAKLDLLPKYDMSELCKSINEASDLLNLEVQYKLAYKTARSNQDHLTIITDLKDRRKSELTPDPVKDEKALELDQGWEEFKDDKL